MTFTPVEPKTDSLTGFYIKEEFEPLVDRMTAECGVLNRPFSILIIDLDRFKYFNDKYGHLSGDELIKYFAKSVRSGLAAVEYSAVRFGGDEFILVFPGIDSSGTCAIARDLLKTLGKRPYFITDHKLSLRFSGGIAEYPDDGNDSRKLFSKADKAMYFSKLHGGNKVTEFKKMRLEAAKNIAFILTALFFILIILYAVMYLVRIRAPRVLENIGRVKISVSPSDYHARGKDVIYLNSGGVFKGDIVREDADEVEMRMGLSTGEGTIVARKSDIKNIERGGDIPEK